MRRTPWLLIALLFPTPLAAQSGEVKIVRPAEIDDVLVNPGIGFTTFQRFNGDALNEGMGWTEGRPIEGRNVDGWYPMGTITVEDGPYRVGVDRNLDTP